MDKGKFNVPINPSYHERMSEFAQKWEEERSGKYKEYRRKWAENPRNFIVEHGPMHLDIEPTNACNLRCPMCPRTLLVEDSKHGKNEFKVGMMDLAFYKDIIDQAVEIGVYSIKLNWLGEPLVHKDIVEMVRYAKQKGIVDVMFNTNAVTLDEKMTRDFIEAGLDKIFFSFDSINKEKYEEIRVGANFERTLENIKAVKRIREEMGKDIPLTRVSMVLMEENQHEYDGFVQLFKDVVDVIGYGDYVDPEYTKDKREEDPKRKKVNRFVCAQLWQRMFISWDGEVSVCCRDVNRGYPIGNAHKGKLKDIWKSAKYEYIREKHQSGDYNDISICAKCSLPEFTEDGSY